MALTRQVQLKTVAEGIDPHVVSEIREIMDYETACRAKIVWDKLKKNFNKIKLESLAKDADVTLNPTHVKRLVNSNKSFSEFNQAFKFLPIDIQKKLVRAATQN